MKLQEEGAALTRSTALSISISNQELQITDTAQAVSHDDSVMALMGLDRQIGRLIKDQSNLNDTEIARRVDTDAARVAQVRKELTRGRA